VEAELSSTSASAAARVDKSVSDATTTELHDSVQLVLDQREIDIIGALLEKLHEYNLLPVSGESKAEIEVVIEISRLVSQIGLCVLPVWCQCQHQPRQEPLAAYQDQIQARMNQVLDLFFRAFAYDDIDVSLGVIPLAASLVKVLDRDTVKNRGEIARKIQQHVPQMLNILYQQLKYPVGYDRESDDDVDAEEQLYRDELCKLYTKFVRVQPSLCLQFVYEACSQWLLPDSISSRSLATSPQDVEATLRLLYHYAEGIQPPPGVRTAVDDLTFGSLLVAIHSSGLVRRFGSYENHFVLLLYYEVAVRYSPIFHQEPHTQLLAPLLEAMSGVTGLQHADAKMRSRCCFLLLRLVTSLSKLLRPFVETAVSGIQQLLAQSFTQPNLLRVEDVMYLFETIGILVGKTGVDATQQQQYLTSLLTPHIQAMENILSKPDLARDVQHYGDILSCSISAISHLSKGFSKQPPNGVQAILVEPMHVTLRAVEALPSCESVRNKSMVLVQRMILCIGDKVLPFCPQLLFHLIAHCTSDDILFVAQIFIQLCTKFKQRATDVIDSPLMPFLRKCQSVIPQAEASVDSGTPPHLKAEQLSIQKLAFAVLLAIVTNHVTRVLLSTTNVGSLELVLRTVCDGAVLVRDGVVQRTCIKFFRELVKQWGEPAASSVSVASEELVYRHGFMSFVIQVFLVGMMRTFLDTTFNLQDANQSRCVSELSHVLFGCLMYDAEATLASVSCFLPNASDLRSATQVELLEKKLRELLVASQSGPSTNGFR
jgi:exportin-T